MEIRNLTEREITFASELAKVVYRSSVEPYFTDQQMRQAFYGYVDRDALHARWQDHQLMIWGAFENNNLCAVGGMQPEGHITMLYVLPQFQRRGIGRKLLAAMQKYAFSTCKLAGITVNATPAWTANYFKKSGFRMMRQQSGNGAFASLEKKSSGVMEYETRPISPKVLLGISIGVLCLIVAVTLIYVITSA